MRLSSPGLAALARVAVISALFALSGCASSSSLDKALNPDPPEKMYADADVLMSKGKFDEAAKKFEDIDRDHPYSPEARRALVMSSFANYKALKYPEAIAAAERYTTLHSGTKEAALAQYVIASAHYDEIKPANRDQAETRKALDALLVLKSRYPDSQYAKDVDNRIRVCQDNLAASEMETGRYYLKKHQYTAALNRFKTVVAEYQTTEHVEEALERMVESYMALGITNEAQNTAAVLGHNFPDSRWYKDAYDLLASGGLTPREEEGNWLQKTWKSLPSLPSLPKLGLGGPG